MSIGAAPGNESRAQAPSSIDRKMIQKWHFRIEAMGSANRSLGKGLKLGAGEVNQLCASANSGWLFMTLFALWYCSR
jgi:hypothetical protein